MEAPNDVETVMDKLKGNIQSCIATEASMSRYVHMNADAPNSFSLHIFNAFCECVAKGAESGGGNAMEDQVLARMKLIQEEFVREREENNAIVKSQFEHIKALTEVVADHGRAIHGLIKLIHSLPRGNDSVKVGGRK
ncbi:hypothetical protein PIB30_025481 [Stylosanthes scabra]|uniref:Uncharacterized protein n=1 Tax=Stylosanthes scabra TaxID=79078 RepID=A0ABU6W8L4_9FABA|nr:hypothetical protein [Stylosanthes scabra]